VVVVINSAARVISGVYKTHTELAYMFSNIPTLEELYVLESETEVDRALRVPAAGMGLHLHKGELSDLLAEPLRSLDSRFPPSKFHRRPLPPLKSYTHLTRNFGRISIDIAKSIESQEEFEGALGGYDLEVHSDGGATEPKVWYRSPNKSSGAWVGRLIGEKVFSMGGADFLGWCNHSFGAERGAMTKAARELIPSVIESLQRLQRVPRILIATDSLSLLMALQSRQIKCGEDIDLVAALDKLATLADVGMRHVRGHSGIDGNEAADRAATLAMQREANHASCSLLQEAVKADIKAEFRKTRATELSDLAKEKPAVKRTAEMCQGTAIRKHLKIDIPVWIGRAWCQVLAGYCPRISGYRHPTDVGLSGKCLWCGTFSDDVYRHFFLECANHADSRAQWQADIEEEQRQKLQEKIDKQSQLIGIAAPSAVCDEVSLEMEKIAKFPLASMKFIRRGLCDKRCQCESPGAPAPTESKKEE